MSYNGTVRCSWCYKTGHNRSSCPERKRYIAENPDSYEAKREQQKKERSSKRKCGFCLQTGHNRATCEEQKKVLEILTQGAVALRKIVVPSLKRAGFGVGTLVEDTKISSYYGSSLLSIVTKLDWEGIKVGQFRGIYERPIEDWSMRWITTSVVSTGVKDYTSLSSLIIHSPLSAEQVEAQIPEGFMEARDEKTVKALKSWIKKREHYDWDTQNMLGKCKEIIKLVDK